MANRQTYVVGALGLLMGMAVGASSGQSAELVSYSGTNPNSIDVRVMEQFHRAAGYLRFRNGVSPSSRTQDAETHITAPRTLSRTEAMARRIQNMRNSDNTATIRGVPVQTTSPVPECAGYTRERYIRCLEAFINGEPYETNYFPTDYEDQ